MDLGEIYSCFNDILHRRHLFDSTVRRHLRLNTVATVGAKEVVDLLGLAQKRLSVTNLHQVLWH